MAMWFVTFNDGVHGPLSDAQLKDAADQGRIVRETPVRQDGRSDNILASQVPGLFDAPKNTAGPSHPVPPPPPPPPGPAPTPPPPPPDASVSSTATSLAKSQDAAPSQATPDDARRVASLLDDSGIAPAESDSPSASPPSALDRFGAYEGTPYKTPSSAMFDDVDELSVESGLPPSSLSSSSRAHETPTPTASDDQTPSFFLALPKVFARPFKRIGSLIGFVIARCRPSKD